MPSHVPQPRTTYLAKKDFGNFLLNAANGAAITYAVSNKFAGACETDKDLAAIRAMAWDGPCILVQRRVPTSDGLFEYIAIRSGQGRHFLRPKPEFYEDDYFNAGRKQRRKAKSLSDVLEMVE